MKHNPWTPDELEILKQRYATEGSSVAKYIKHTPASCRTRARLLGLKFYRTAGQSKPWSPDEDEKIRQHYPVMGSRMLYMLPGKNKTDLFARAIRLGVKFKRGD